MSKKISSIIQKCARDLEKACSLVRVASGHYFLLHEAVEGSSRDTTYLLVALGSNKPIEQPIVRADGTCVPTGDEMFGNGNMEGIDHVTGSAIATFFQDFHKLVPGEFDGISEIISLDPLSHAFRNIQAAEKLTLVMSSLVNDHQVLVSRFKYLLTEQSTLKVKVHDRKGQAGVIIQVDAMVEGGIVTGGLIDDAREVLSIGMESAEPCGSTGLKCPYCMKHTKPGSSCTSCGKSLMIICPSCGSITGLAKKCKTCGISLEMEIIA